MDDDGYKRILRQINADRYLVEGELAAVAIGRVLTLRQELAQAETSAESMIAAWRERRRGAGRYPRV